jgi:hypothetical protein
MDLGGLRLISVGNYAFAHCINLTSIVASSPCTLGVVKPGFSTGTFKLTSFSFANMTITSLADGPLYNAGIATLDLGGLRLVSLGSYAFAQCQNLTQVSATSPCSLGIVGDSWLASTPKLSAFSFHNITVVSIGDDMLAHSGVAQVDVGGLRDVRIGATQCLHLARVIATAVTAVTHFAGHAVECHYTD